MNWIKRVFRKPTPLEFATRELIEAEHELLMAQTGQEYSSALITYNQSRITRLRKYITTLAKQEETK